MNFIATSNYLIAHTKPKHIQNFNQIYIMHNSSNSSQNNHDLEDFRAKIALLPQRNLALKVPHILNQAYEYQGFWYRHRTLEGLMVAQHHFIALPSSTLIASYPKTGTTWLKALAFSIATRSKYDIYSNPLQKELSHDCVPFLEYDIPQNQSHNHYPDIPLFSTHVPYTSLPESVIDSGCKIVYICRDPTDAFVSWWHFAQKTAPKELEFLPIEEAFQQFCDGHSFYGPYWEHLLGYWRASLDRPDNILFLKYEDLKINTLMNVNKLADFMGYPFSIDEERDGVVERLIDLCSFKHMRNLEVNKSRIRSNDTQPHKLANTAYFRKAVVGDWKNYIPANMKEKMDQIMELKLRGSGLIL